MAGIWAQGRRGTELAPRGFRILDAQPGRPGPVVKGAPYTADASTEISQTLADGNKIHQSSSERVYRDSEGRTRRETSLTGFGAPAAGSNSPELAFIDDPVAGASYALDLTNRTARGTVFRSSPPNGAALNRAPRPRPQDANIRTESLGRQIVNGVAADGTRTTQTIPAGQIGNTLPIQIVSERWYSPDLQTIVLEKRSDPRSGEMVFQLTNIIRAEPSPTLFAPPVDFQLIEPNRTPRRRAGQNPPQ